MTQAFGHKDRYKSHANVIVPALKMEATVEDINSGGLKLRSGAKLAFRTAKIYPLKLIPEPGSGMSKIGINEITLEAEMCWQKEIDGSYYTGMSLDRVPDIDNYNKYLDYLASVAASQQPPA